jgi:hypothetical protein
VAHQRGVAGFSPDILAPDVLERQDHRHERLRRRLPSRNECIGEHQPLVLHNLQIDAPVGELGPVRPAHHYHVAAARPHIEFGLRRRPRQRSEPLHQQRGIGPGPEHFRRRRVDHARQNQVAIGGFFGLGHVLSPVGRP